ncbi:MAG: DnaJ domain-containing protein [Elusimicrobiota bacterium]|nr:DnaJ domain-containing protein [Elusimicrobiota bacterium]
MKKELRKAADLLGIGNRISLVELKNSYKKLALKFHPDRCPEGKKRDCEKKFKKLKEAYEKLLDYCLNFGIPLDGEKLSESQETGDEDHLKRFYDGWWFDLNDKK